MPCIAEFAWVDLGNAIDECRVALELKIHQSVKHWRSEWEL